MTYTVNAKKTEHAISFVIDSRILNVQHPRSEQDIAMNIASFQKETGPLPILKGMNPEGDLPISGGVLDSFSRHGR
jgi:hypothetical protein